MKSFTHIGEMSRLEAFSDAVFAVSATLLVVSLEIPETIPELTANLKGFAALGLSFLALVLIWSVHNAFFRRYDLQDRITIILNNCLLFVVLFYVYPLKFLAEGISAVLFSGAGNISSFNELSTMFILYSGGFVAVFLCFSLLYLHASRSKDKLGLNPEQQHETRSLFRNYMILVTVGSLSVLLAWLNIGLEFGLPGMVYFLLIPLCWWHGKWSARKLKHSDFAVKNE